METIDERTKTLSDYLDVLRRHRTVFLSTVFVILVASLGVAFGLPPIYQSSATILIEQQEIPEDLVRTTVTSYADERIQIISQQVMTRANLGSIVEKYRLSAEERGKLKENIELEMISVDVGGRDGRSSTIAFTLSYKSGVPEMAKAVVDELVSLYLDANKKRRTEGIDKTFGFLESEAKKLAETISELEARLAVFKEENAGRLPELANLNMTLMDRTEREFMGVERRIQSLVDRRIYLQSGLAQLDPVGPVYSGNGQQRVLTPSGRLKALQGELLTATARYSPDHPDVIRLKKEIEALKVETGVTSGPDEIATELNVLHAQLSEAQKRYSEEHPDVKRLKRSIANLDREYRRAQSSPRPVVVENPAYIQFETQIKSADTELATLQANAQALRDKMALYEQRLLETPGVEREYKSLTRDYESAVSKYKEVTDKLMQAKLARSLETEQKGERFTLIEPSVLPTSPAEPNRLAIGFLGFVLSLIGGIGGASIAEAMDRSVHGRQSVTELLGVPPLGVIPYIDADDEDQRKAGNFTAVGALAFVSVAVLFVYWLVTDEQMISLVFGV